MGFFGKIGSALKKFVQFASQAFSSFGSFKKVYDGANNLSGGAIGSQLEGIPGIGEALKSIGGGISSINGGAQNKVQGGIDKFNNNANFAPRGQHLPGLQNID